jgi:hypothetical protein
VEGIVEKDAHRDMLRRTVECHPHFRCLSERPIHFIVSSGAGPRARNRWCNRRVLLSNTVLTLARVREKFAAFGVELSGGTPEQFSAQIKKDALKWGDVLKRAGIKPD